MLMRMLQTQLKKEFRDLRFSDWNVENPFSDYWEKQVLRKQPYLVFFNLKLQFVLILTSNFDVFWKVKLPRWIKAAFPLTGSCHSSDSAVGMHKSKVEYPSQRSICCLLKRLKACTFSFFVLLVSRLSACLSNQCANDQIHKRAFITLNTSSCHSMLLSPFWG